MTAPTDAAPLCDADPAQQALWQRLQAYRFGEAAAALAAFVRRVAERADIHPLLAALAVRAYRPPLHWRGGTFAELGRRAGWAVALLLQRAAIAATILVLAMALLIGGATVTIAIRLRAIVRELEWT